jgi:hypothetical protein
MLCVLLFLSSAQSTQFKTHKRKMIRAPKESKQGRSARRKVVDAFDHLMIDADDISRNLSDFLNGTVADDTLSAFNKFDASLRFDKNAQFQDSFHICAVGLDSAHCTSSASNIESNTNTSTVQRPLVSIDKSSHYKLAFLDTSQSHTEDDDDSSFSSSCSFFESKPEHNQNKYDLLEKSKPPSTKGCEKLVQQRPAISRTSSRRLITSKPSWSDKPVFDREVRRTKSSHNLFDDMQLMKTKPRSSSVSKLISSCHCSGSSSRRPNECPPRQSSRRRIITKSDSSKTKLQSSSHHSQDSHRNPLQSPPCTASSRDLKRSKSGQLLIPSDHFSSSFSGHSPQHRSLDKGVKQTKSGQTLITADLSSSSSGHSQQRRPFDRDLRMSKSGLLLSPTDLFSSSSSSSGHSQQRRPLNKVLKRTKSRNSLSPLNYFSSSSSGHSQQRRPLDRHVRKTKSGQSLNPADLFPSSSSGHSHQSRSSGKVGIGEHECSNGLGFTSSHHSQSSSRRQGLSSSRHRGQGSSRSDLGTPETQERMEFVHRTATPPSTRKQHRSQSRSRSRANSFADEPLQRALMAAPKERRGRSRSRPRLKSVESEPATEIKENRRRCHSQPRLITKSLSDNFRLEHPLIFRNETKSKNEHQPTYSREEEISIAPLDARTAARIERARASREKHLAKLQKEKEKTRNENRNPELLRTCSSRQLDMLL